MKIGDDEDFVIIPPLPENPPGRPKGVQCGLCGMKFPHGTPVWYSCSMQRCPIFRNRQVWDDQKKWTQDSPEWSGTVDLNSMPFWLSLTL